MFFQAKDHEALTVLIRFVESQGERVLRVRPVNETFILEVTGDIEITNQTDLRPFISGVLDLRRTYWEEIVEIKPCAVETLSVFDLSQS